MTTPGPTTAASTERKAIKGVRVGVVVSDKRDKSRKVVATYQIKHPKYGKFIKQRSMFQVHDESNDSRQGDTVEIVPCRPISKTKSWRLVRVIERAPGGPA